MFINNISITQFRNIEQTNIKFGSHFNILHGLNGQGKTNFLEAIFLIGTLKSFKHAKNLELIRWDQPASILKCLTTEGKLQHELVVSIDPHKKHVSVDNKSPSRLIDYCNLISVVAFSPEELIMVDGTPDQRRRYLDRAIFCSNSGYLKIYHDYYRVLKQRNHLLRNHIYSGMEAWTDQLIAAGAKLITARKCYIEELTVFFAEFYRSISASDEDGYLCYHPNSLSDFDSYDDISINFRSALTANFKQERDRGTTLNGPHRDDIGFYLSHKQINQHGSQGQKKSFVLAMKMAEIEYLKSKREEYPILLLDDMTAELDKYRVQQLLEFLIKRDMQVFITTTDKTTVPIPESILCSYFHIESGRLVK